MLANPRQSAIHNYLRAPLHALVAIFVTLAAVKPSIVGIKAAVEAGRCGTFWIEHLRTDKRRRAITMLVEDIRKIRNVFCQRSSQIVEVIELRIGARQNRGVRGRRQGHVCVSAGKNHSQSSHGVEVWGKSRL